MNRCISDSVSMCILLSFMHRYINRVAAHPDLQTDPAFVDFLEVEGDLPKATSTSALSSAGVMRLFNRVGDSIVKSAIRVDETDQVGKAHTYLAVLVLRLYPYAQLPARSFLLKPLASS